MFVRVLVLSVAVAAALDHRGHKFISPSEDLRGSSPSANGRCAGGELLDVTTDTCIHIPFRAHAEFDQFGEQQLITASLAAHSMKHEWRACGEFAAKTYTYDFHAGRRKDAEFEHSYRCFEGRFSRHSVHEGMYTCEFGRDAGRLFVQTFVGHGSDERCISILSSTVHTGTHTFRTDTLKTESTMDDRLAIYAKNDRLWVHYTAHHANTGYDCQVSGFYCVVENATRRVVYESKDLRPQNMKSSCGQATEYTADGSECIPIPFRARNFGDTGLETAVMSGGRMEHDGDRCRTVSKRVAEIGGFFDYEFECFEGEFDRHSEYEGIYTCDFGERFGRLFVQSYTRSDTEDVYAKDVFSTASYTGVHSFVIETLRTEWTDDATNTSIYAARGDLWLRDSIKFNLETSVYLPPPNTDCRVKGLYCLYEKAVTPVWSRYESHAVGAAQFEAKIPRATFQELKAAP